MGETAVAEADVIQVVPQPQVEEGDDNLTADQLSRRDAYEKSLWWWNLGCGLFHLFQAAIALGLGLADTSAGKFRLPLTTLFLQWDPVTKYPTQQLVQRGLIPFAAVTSGFAWMSAAAHFIVLLRFDKYKRDLRKGLNTIRWYEYACSSSLMIALMAMLFGVYDIITLVLIMVVNASMNLFGLDMELLNQRTPIGEVDWRPFVHGSFAGAAPWACIIAYVAGIDNQSQIPGFVWAILIVYAVAFNTFPWNMYFQYKRVGWWAPKYWGGRGSSGYYFGEKLYCVQSLVSKSILLWLVLGGVNQPNTYAK